MKIYVGFAYFLLVVIVAILLTLEKEHTSFRARGTVFLGRFFQIYFGTIVIGGLMWGFASIGIFLREAAQWMIEAVFSPFMFLSGMF